MCRSSASACCCGCRYGGIEPLWRKQAFVGHDLLVAAIALPGVALVVGGIPDNMMFGLLFGIMAALLAAVFSLIDKGLALQAPALALTTVQMAAGMALLGLLMPFWSLLGDGLSLPERQDMSGFLSWPSPARWFHSP